jgi:hypothetical protein
MQELAPEHHIFRHIKQSWMDGDFIDPAAFRLAVREGQLEPGLSVNWVEFFQRPAAMDAVAPLREILEKKGRKVGGNSKFAMLNVGAAKRAAALYAAVAIATDDDPEDPSHTQITGYTAFNSQVAEELAKVIITTFPVKP